MFPVNEKGLLLNTDELIETLSDVQKKGNRDVMYKTDMNVHGVNELWTYPKAFDGKFVGDCEDISLYKMKLLQEAGVPLGPVLMTICLDPRGSGHCVLCVCAENKDYILCNSHEIVTTPKIMVLEGYKFLYRQGLNRKLNEPWDALK